MHLKQEKTVVQVFTVRLSFKVEVLTSQSLIKKYFHFTVVEHAYQHVQKCVAILSTDLSFHQLQCHKSCLITTFFELKLFPFLRAR